MIKSIQTTANVQAERSAIHRHVADQISSAEKGKLSPATGENIKDDQRLLGAKTPKEISKEELEQEVQNLNDVLVAADKNLRFKFHDETEQLYVELIDAKTLQVIKSLPPEYMLELAAKMKELIGLFIDEKI